MDESTLDRLLSDLHHDVPEGFSRRVMQSIKEHPVSVASAVPKVQLSDPAALGKLGRLQWIVLIGGGLFGVGQIARIIFGLWFTAAAW